MHEAAFSIAALPAPARILGLPLRPYSLGHELWLLREKNPLAVFHDTRVAVSTISREQLMEAVLICNGTHAELSRLHRDWFITLKLKLWGIRVRQLNHYLQLAEFLEYRRLGSLNFPTDPPDHAQNCRTPGAPFLLRLFQFLTLTLGVPASQAWDYPLGMAQMHMATWYESQRSLNIKNEHDLAFDDGYEKWDAEQWAEARAQKGKLKKGPHA